MIVQQLRSLFWRRKTPKRIPIAGDQLPENVFSFLQAVHKAEIHLHFEGATTADTIYHLAQKYQEPSVRTRADAEWCLYFAYPRQFFEQFLFVSGLFREIEDFYRAAVDLGKRFEQEKIRYAEITFAPHKFMMAGLSYPELIEAIATGVCEGAGEAFDVGLVIDIVRDLGPEAGWRVVREIEAHPHEKVVGIGLGGGENYPASASQEIFAYAKSLGLRKTAHAGEGLGPESIWQTMRALQVERLDHGVRAQEDPALVDYLTAQRMPFNLCLTSNVMLGVVSEPEAHPLRRYHERGIPVNVSTDDPAFFRTSLTEEYAKLLVYQGFTPKALLGLIDNALAASFLPEETKTALTRDIRLENERLLSLYDIA